MKNKVLLNIYIPQIDESYEIYVPLNKNIANVICLIGKSITELKHFENFDYNNLQLYNIKTAIPYKPDSLVRDTDINNSSKLILM